MAAVVAAAGALEHVFPPVPGDLVVTLGAAVAFASQGAAALCFVAAVTGSFAGASLTYAAGRWLSRRGEGPRPAWAHRLHDRILAATAALDRHGAGILVVSRFVPGVRGIVVLAAGFHRLPPSRALPAVAAGAALWDAALFALAAAVGRNLHALARWLDAYAKVALAAATLGTLAWLAWRALRR